MPEKIIPLLALLACAALAAWLERQTEPPAEPRAAPGTADAAPDYYIENFVAEHLEDEHHRRVIEASRLTHFPRDGVSVVEDPHVIQYREGSTRHLYARRGSISADGGEILLTGEVRAIESRSDDRPGHVTTARRMRIKLARDGSPD